MSYENVEKFYEIVANDEDLQERLLVEEDSNEEFIKKAIAAANEHGLSFTAEEVEDWFIEQEAANEEDGELSDLELEAVAGGKGRRRGGGGGGSASSRWRRRRRRRSSGSSSGGGSSSSLTPEQRRQHVMAAMRARREQQARARRAYLERQRQARGR